MLEVTITHSSLCLDEVCELFNRKWIAIDWGCEWEKKGLNPEDYTGGARTQLRLFNEMSKHGAAVVAAYGQAPPRRSDRVVGCVKSGTEYKYFNGLLCLPLSDANVHDSAISFLGNLPPRQCAVQKCHERARGRLKCLALGKPIPRCVASLHNLDVECLVTTWLLLKEICLCILDGGRCRETIDHAGYGSNGREVLAQTTVSTGNKVVATKANRLLGLHAPNRELFMFAPEAARGAFAWNGIQFISIEDVFKDVDATPQGKWLISRMLGSQ